MASKAYKLLKRIRQSARGWKAADVRSLYESFGFVISHGGGHDTVKHPDFLDVPSEILYQEGTMSYHLPTFGMLLNASNY